MLNTILNALQQVWSTHEDVTIRLGNVTVLLSFAPASPTLDDWNVIALEAIREQLGPATAITPDGVYTSRIDVSHIRGCEPDTFEVFAKQLLSAIGR